jgi:hypothetical protein
MSSWIWKARPISAPNSHDRPLRASTGQPKWQLDLARISTGLLTMHALQRGFGQPASPAGSMACPPTLCQYRQQDAQLSCASAEMDACWRDFEGARLRRVAGEDGGGFVEGAMTSGAPRRNHRHHRGQVVVP